MAGSADREREAPGERESELEPLVFVQIEDCPQCETPFEVVFETQVYDKEMLNESDFEEKEVSCPNCGSTFLSEYTGWTATDAGA